MQMSQHKLELRDRWVNELYVLKTGSWLSMKARTCLKALLRLMKVQLHIHPISATYPGCGHQSSSSVTLAKRHKPSPCMNVPQWKGLHAHVIQELDCQANLPLVGSPKANASQTKSNTKRPHMNSGPQPAGRLVPGREN